MDERPKEFLKASGVYAPLFRLRQFFRKKIYRVKHASNRLAHRAGSRFGAGNPGTFFYGIFDRWYVNLTGLQLKDIRSKFSKGTRMLNHIARSPAAPPGPKKALVFIKRGIWFNHNLHNYMIGCALRELGFAVSFVTCSGRMEACGIHQANDPWDGPPYACKACRSISRGVFTDGFGWEDLGCYKTADEEERIQTIARRYEENPEFVRFGGIPVLDTLRPFLVRYYRGDFRKIDAGDPDVLIHVKATARFYLRYGRLLDATRPSCVCLFNGLFFPEYFFLKEARSRGIPALCSERGMRSGTLFLSLNEPACHYRADALWERLKETIGLSEIAAARQYLDRRIEGPEDPSGHKRNLTDSDTGKYRELARDGYVVFFAPLTHDTASMEKDDATSGFFGAVRSLAAIARRRGKKLLVRSHPDETRSVHTSRYTVMDFLKENSLVDSRLVRCLHSAEKWDPYKLAAFADGIVVYNGMLGIELPSLGHRIFNIARSHYTGKGFTEEVASLDDLERVFEPEKIMPFTRRETEAALKYLYFYVFKANIPIHHLLGETRPFDHSLVENVPMEEKRGQFKGVKERVAFLLGDAAFAQNVFQKEAEVV